MSSSGVERSANSPLSDDEEKRHRVLGDSIVDDPDATIIDSRFLRSTALDGPTHTMSVADSTIKEQLKAALCDPGFLDLVSGAVASPVSRFSPVTGRTRRLKGETLGKGQAKFPSEGQSGCFRAVQQMQLR